MSNRFKHAPPSFQIKGTCQEPILTFRESTLSTRQFRRPPGARGQAACLRWMTDLSGSTQTYSHNPTSNQECVHTHTHTHTHTNAQGTSSVRTRDARARSHAMSRHLGELPSLAPDSSAESRHRPYNQRTNALQTLTGKHQSRDSRGTAEQVCGALCVGAAVGVDRKTAISTGCGQRGASSRRGSSF